MPVILIDECLVFGDEFFLFTQSPYFHGIFADLCDFGFTDFRIVLPVFPDPVIQFGLPLRDLSLGLLKIGTYAGGPPNLFTLPLFINPQTGDTTDLKNAVICILISMAITFVLTFLFYKDEKADQIDAQG